jgi:hypothetical protein
VVWTLECRCSIPAQPINGRLRQDLANLRFAWQSRQASGNIVVMGIDASSIEKIGVCEQFHSEASYLACGRRVLVRIVRLLCPLSTIAPTAASQRACGWHFKYLRT